MTIVGLVIAVVIAGIILSRLHKSGSARDFYAVEWVTLYDTGRDLLRKDNDGRWYIDRSLVAAYTIKPKKKGEALLTSYRVVGDQNSDVIAARRLFEAFDDLSAAQSYFTRFGAKPDPTNVSDSIASDGRQVAAVQFFLVKINAPAKGEVESVWQKVTLAGTELARSRAAVAAAFV